MIRMLLALIAIVLFLVFIAQNASYVDVNFFYTWKVPLFVLLLLSFGLGFVVPYLYFLAKEIPLKNRLSKLENALRELGRGYLGRSERLLSTLANSFKEVGVVYAFVLDLLGRHEELKRLEGPACAFAGQMLLKRGFVQEAREKFQEALKEDKNNLTALKGLRDISFLEGRIEEALELQEKVLELVEKGEKDAQKAIKAELLAYLYLTKGEDKLAQEAYDSYLTPYVLYAYIVSLLRSGKTKEAKKQLEKAFSLGFQEDIFWYMLEDQKSLAELYDYIEGKRNLISPDTLAMIYLKLNLLKRIEDIKEEISPAVKAIVHSATSHKEEDRLFGKVVEDLICPFACSCGKPYKNYKLLCDNCYTWTNVKRRGSYACGC